MCVSPKILIVARWTAFFFTSLSFITPVKLVVQCGVSAVSDAWNHCGIKWWQVDHVEKSFFLRTFKSEVRILLDKRHHQCDNKVAKDSSLNIADVNVTWKKADIVIARTRFSSIYCEHHCSFGQLRFYVQSSVDSRHMIGVVENFQRNIWEIIWVEKEFAGMENNLTPLKKVTLMKGYKVISKISLRHYEQLRGK